MPIYRYYCTDCSVEEEVIVPIAERDNRRHSCGFLMQRLLTVPALVQFSLTGKDKTLKVLNNKDGHDFPGGNKHKARYEKAFAKGLDPPKQTIGRGF